MSIQAIALQKAAEAIALFHDAGGRRRTLQEIGDIIGITGEAVRVRLVNIGVRKPNARLANENLRARCRDCNRPGIYISARESAQTPYLCYPCRRKTVAISVCEICSKEIPLNRRQLSSSDRNPSGKRRFCGKTCQGEYFSQFGQSALNKRKTHCMRGHLFDEQNTIRRPNNGRECRTCSKHRERAGRVSATQAYRHNCQRCRYVWDSLRERPGVCPRCKSYVWDTPHEILRERPGK